MDDDENVSFGYLAVALLNGALRPFIAYWHPRLAAYEASQQADVTAADYESQWEQIDKFRRELKEVGKILTDYALILSKATGAPSLLRAVEETRRPGT
jgi:hypothetical protein